jgi:hypothetical protein
VRPADSAPADLLAALSAALGSLRARWYLFGAQAALIWGRPRLTADVDVTVQLDPEDPDRLVDALEAAGFTLRVSRDADFVRRTRVLPFAYGRDGLPLDVVLAGPGLEEGFLERARTVIVAGVPIPVISPEDLIITKVLAGRPKDLEDIRGVLREQLPSLDVEAIRGTLTLLEEALSQNDLRPLFEQELSRARRSASR